MTDDRTNPPPAETKHNEPEQSEEPRADEQPPAGERQQPGPPRDRQIKSSGRNR